MNEVVFILGNNTFLSMVQPTNMAHLDVLLCCPGEEIPEWFNHQRVGGSVTIKLPLLCSSLQNFMGFAFCLIVENSYLRRTETWQNLNWEIHLKTNYNYERRL